MNSPTPAPLGDGWSNMASAPRDGTIIELCCVYGIMPWYGLFSWRQMEYNGKPVGEFKWVDARNPAGSISDEKYLLWRLTTQTLENYVDPTQGAQVTLEYWR